MSGSTIGGFVGGAIGYYVGGSQGAQIGWMIGSAIGGYVDPDVIKGPRLTDAQAVTVQEGAFRYIVYGTAVVGGNIIQCGPLAEHKHKERTGKGGPVQQTYTYTRTVAIGICEGPVGGVLRIWQDGKLVYDARNPAQWPAAADAIKAMASDTAKYASTFTFYSGSETQLPDPSLEALDTTWGGGAGNVPAYRGTAYIVFPSLDVTNSGGAVPQFRFEVACCGSTVSTLHDVPWVHGNTGTTQSIFAGAIYQTTALVAGWNDNLRRTRDGGRTWTAVPYTSSLGWSPSAAISGVAHVIDPSVGPQGVWYISKGDDIAISYDAGGSFAHYLTPAHNLTGDMFVVSGVLYAGVSGAAHTSYFQPLVTGDSVVDLGANYGDVSTIGDLSGQVLVGTSTGKILSGPGSVLYSNPEANPITSIVSGDNGICLASLSITGGGYVYSNDGFATTTLVTGVYVYGFAFARGVFYRVLLKSVQASTDGLTWADVDTSFAPNELSTYIYADSPSVLAVTQDGKTAALPTTYVLPDVPNWAVDLFGNIVGATTITTDKCDANVADIVADQCARVGITASRIDVTGITDTVRGFVVGKQGSASDNIRALQSGFFFDFPEWGDSADKMTKLRAIKRGGDSKVTITDNDLVWSDDDQDTRAQAVEFPRKINLITADVDADYNPTKQTAERQTQDVKAVGESTVELPIAATRTEAAPIVDKMLKVAWTEAEGTWERELPPEFTQYTPSDCFVHDGKRWRIERAEQGDGTVKWTAKRDRASAYTSSATAETPITPAPPNLSIRGPTVFAAMNLPSLRSADNVPGMYVAVCGLLPGWVGCDLQLSVDGGLTYASIGTLTSECTMGDLTAEAGTSGTITARVFHNHALESCTDAQLAARANAFAVTTAGTSEIGRFKTATATANAGEYDLTDVVRGDLGTTVAAHHTGDQFVLLDGTQTFIPLDASLAGKTIYFRPVSLGTAPANNTAYPVVFQPLFTTGTTIDFIRTKSGDAIRTLAGDYLQATTA